MIKAILMDMDGVLVDACEWHYLSLNKALKEISNIEISYEEHISDFNGLPTRKKLNKLTEQGRIKLEDHDSIFNKKQYYTIETIKETAKYDEKKVNLHQHNRWNGLKLACCTNSITTTTIEMLKCTGQLDYMDCIITNEVVKFPKPHGECYIRAMVKFGVYPNECVIIEDSPVGIQAAKSTGAYIWKVSGCEEVNLKNFQQFMVDLNSGRYNE